MYRKILIEPDSTGHRKFYLNGVLSVIDTNSREEILKPLRVVRESLEQNQNEVGNALVSAACSGRAKSKLTKAYESSVNFFSQKTGKVFNSCFS